MNVLPKPKDYTEVINKTKRLEKDNKDLKDTIDYLKSKGETIKVITRTKTVLVGQTQTVNLLPDDYTFKLDNGMPVAAIKVEDEDEWDLITYDLTFKSDIVISEKSTLVKLVAKSSGSETLYELPVEITTHTDNNGSQEEKERILDPRLALGVGISIPYTGPEVTLALPILKGPKDKWSWIAPVVSISSTPKIGIMPAMYNIAKPLPLVDNIWLGAAYETNVINHYGSVIISAKL